jgi:lipopolysaccharide transport system ATP-binding protein
MIKANKLGKCYRIYDTPMARLKQALWRQRKQFYREFWALKNISFEVKRGESLGIIGRNGSGKSTLLQLICGTLTPTEGSLSANGRIAALLELGSGFNPEFTGLENVYLNASLLGLSKEETNANLEDILAFADIGEFAHQPVKSYSSGMTVRLAFAVIAHVNADILVVDEALAVGDAIFVQRCMRFIRKMREERCLLFVSHEPETVKSLCSHALWLSNGSTQAYGKCRSVTLEYLR